MVVNHGLMVLSYGHELWSFHGTALIERHYESQSQEASPLDVVLDVVNLERSHTMAVQWCQTLFQFGSCYDFSTGFDLRPCSMVQWLHI